MPPTAWGVADYARWVVHYLDSVGLPRVHLIAHSFGGRIGLVLGADYPERVGKIAADQLSMTAPKEQPRMFDLNAEELERVTTK